METREQIKKAYSVFALCTIVCDEFDGNVDLSDTPTLVDAISFNKEQDRYEVTWENGDVDNLADMLEGDKEMMLECLDAVCWRRDSDEEFDIRVSAALGRAANKAEE